MTSSVHPLLEAADVALRVNVPKKRVYTLPIAQVRIGPRTIRWREEDVDAFLETATTMKTPVPTGVSTAAWAKPATEARPWRSAATAAPCATHTEAEDGEDIAF